jgi:glycogen operon protein
LNFVTVHDGFTLRDLVSYESRHNEANGEGNSDGGPEGSSQNLGVEGETTDATVVARRQTIARSLMATMFVSQGVPMLEMGDELWRTQRGNSNAYCHDSELTWVDWRVTAASAAMLAATRELIALRRRLGGLRQREFLNGVRVEEGLKDITWLRTDGTEMQLADWKEPRRATLAFRLQGHPAVVVMMNAEPAPVTFAPGDPMGTSSWRVAFDSSEPGVRARGAEGPAGSAGAVASVEVAAGALVVLVSEERRA